MYYDGTDANSGKSENQSSYFDAFSAYDYMLSVGVKPLVELSFTPDPLVAAWTPALPVPAECTAENGFDEPLLCIVLPTPVNASATTYPCSWYH